MNICIDIQSAIAQRAGVGRYTKLLTQHLGPTADDDNLLLFYFDFKRRGTPFETPHAIHKAVRWCPGRIAQLAWKILRWPSFNTFAGPADVYHFPNFVLPPLSTGKSVVTIHDLSFLRFPEFAENRNRKYLSAKIRDTVARADAIITDSHFSAGEIEALLQVDSARIFPVYPGIDPTFKAPGPDPIESVLSHFQIRRPYILTVGTLEPRKNIGFLIEVFEKLTDFKGSLVIAGMPGWKYEPILQKIKNSSRVSDIRYLRYVDDAHLPALYAGADLFAITSLYEGFGFPPLESMACGTPVISSRGGSLPEVLGAGAWLVDAFDVDLWSTQIRKLLTDPECRQKMTAAGHRQAKKYSWHATARKTWSVYRSL